jgi:hypothetical protein
MEEHPSSAKRSKLSTAAVIKWIRSRFSSKNGNNHKYFYFPHELIKETSI